MLATRIAAFVLGISAFASGLAAQSVSHKTTLIIERATNASNVHVEVRLREDVLAREVLNEPLVLTLTEGLTYGVMHYSEVSYRRWLYVPTALIAADTIRLRFDEGGLTESPDVVPAYSAFVNGHWQSIGFAFYRIRPIEEMTESFDSVLAKMRDNEIDLGQRIWTPEELTFIRDSVRIPVINMVTTLQKRVRVLAQYLKEHKACSSAIATSSDPSLSPSEGSTCDVAGLQTALVSAGCEDIALQSAMHGSHDAFAINAAIVHWVFSVIERGIIGYGRMLELGPALPKAERDSIWNTRITMTQFELLKVAFGTDCNCELAYRALGLPTIQESCNDELSIARLMALASKGDVCRRTLEVLQEVCDAESIKGQSLSAIDGVTTTGKQTSYALHPDSIYLIYVWYGLMTPTEPCAEQVSRIARIVKDAHVTMLHLNVLDPAHSNAMKTTSGWGPGVMLFSMFDGATPYELDPASRNTLPAWMRYSGAFMLVDKNNRIVERIYGTNDVVDKVLALKRKKG